MKNQELTKWWKLKLFSRSKRNGPPQLRFCRKLMALRFSMDFRKLSVVTERQSYLIPRLDLCIKSLGDSLIFLIPVANWGYSPVEIEEDDCNKSALSCNIIGYTDSPTFHADATMHLDLSNGLWISSYHKSYSNSHWSTWTILWSFTNQGWTYRARSYWIVATTHSRHHIEPEEV